MSARTKDWPEGYPTWAVATIRHDSSDKKEGSWFVSFLEEAVDKEIEDKFAFIEAEIYEDPLEQFEELRDLVLYLFNSTHGTESKDLYVSEIHWRGMPNGSMSPDVEKRMQPFADPWVAQR